MCKKMAYEKSLQSGFFKLPNDIFEIGFSGNEIMTFAYLVSCGPNYNPSIRRIVKATGIAKPTVQKAISKLSAYGAINFKSKPRVRTIYGIAPVDKWIFKRCSPSGQKKYPELGNSVTHLQDKQINNLSSKLIEVIVLVKNLVDNKKTFEVPRYLSDWLSHHQPDFTQDELLHEMERCFYGARGLQFFRSIQESVIKTFHEAETERKRREQAWIAFVGERTAPKSTDGGHRV